VLCSNGCYTHSISISDEVLEASAVASRWHKDNLWSPRPQMPSHLVLALALASDPQVLCLKVSSLASIIFVLHLSKTRFDNICPLPFLLLVVTQTLFSVIRLNSCQRVVMKSGYLCFLIIDGPFLTSIQNLGVNYGFKNKCYWCTGNLYKRIKWATKEGHLILFIIKSYTKYRIQHEKKQTKKPTSSCKRVK